MKRIFMILLCCLLMTACMPQQPAPATAAPTLETAVRFTLYTPNENADGFYEAAVVIDALTAQNVVDALIAAQVLNADIVVNSERLEDSRLYLDFNAPFRDQLVRNGTAGEMMMIGSLVNSLLSAYGAASVMITVDGEIVESGHVIYDFPLEFHE